MAKFCKCGHRKKDHYKSGSCKISINRNYLVPERRVNSFHASCICTKFEEAKK